MTVYNEHLQCVHQHMDSGKIRTVDVCQNSIPLFILPTYKEGFKIY